MNTDIARSRWFALAPLAAILLACSSVSTDGELSGTSPGNLPVEMHIRWVIDESFPVTISIHEPPADQALYEVHTYEAGAAPDLGEPIPRNVLRADYSEPRRFIARMRNESDRAVRFWVAPHQSTPHVEEQGLMMFCLCTGEVYEVPANGTWTRIMEFGITRRAELEGPIALTHVIVSGENPAPTPITENPRENGDQR